MGPQVLGPRGPKNHLQLQSPTVFPWTFTPLEPAFTSGALKIGIMTIFWDFLGPYLFPKEFNT